MTVLLGLLIAFVVLPTTLWTSLFFCCRFQRPWARRLAALLPLVVVGTSFRLLPTVPWALGVWLGLWAVAVTWWSSLRPRADRDWVVGLDVMPRAELDGDTLRIREFRNFRYTESGEAVPHYEDRTFDLARLESLDYFLSHWSGPVMAHTLVSFGFNDGRFLTLSVEARRSRGQSYSPLWGLFRSYELFFVLGDERDIVRLRTNVRRERVYLYRVRLSVDRVRQLLLDYLQRVKDVSTRPEWYNSVTSNCTTNLFYHRRHQVPWWTKPAIFLNGFSAGAMYRLGYLDDDLPFKELQAHSNILEKALAADDAEDFSQRIRADLPGVANGQTVGRLSIT